MNMKAPTNGAELHNAYKDELRMREEALVRGAPKDYAEYQKLVGVISGLRLAEQMLKDLLERDEHDIGDSTF
jgi:hypothetical protein